MSVVLPETVIKSQTNSPHILTMAPPVGQMKELHHYIYTQLTFAPTWRRCEH